MRNKTGYFKLGLFIAAATIILIVAVAILAGPNVFRPKTTVETYFIHSISGLEVGSPVKFRGIPVGQVREILLSSEAYPNKKQDLISPNQTVAVVRMDLYLNNQEDLKDELNRHIEQGLRIQTQLAGITGSLYLSIEFLEPEKYPADRIKFNWKPEYAYIPSAPSLSNEIVENVKHFLADLDSANIQKNLGQIGPTLVQLLDNINRITADLDPKEIASLAGSMNQLLITANNKMDGFDVDLLNRLIKQLDQSAKTMDNTMKAAQLKELSTSLTNLSRRLDSVLQNNQYDIQDTLRNLNKATANIEVLTKELSNDPSAIFSRPSDSRSSLIPSAK